MTESVSEGELNMEGIGVWLSLSPYVSRQVFFIFFLLFFYYFFSVSTCARERGRIRGGIGGGRDQGRAGPYHPLGEVLDAVLFLGDLLAQLAQLLVVRLAVRLHLPLQRRQQAGRLLRVRLLFLLLLQLAQVELLCNEERVLFYIFIFPFFFFFYWIEFIFKTEKLNTTDK